jgi:hypothetical protein
MPPVIGDSTVAGTPAVFGKSNPGRGVEGHSVLDHGVVGQSQRGTGVFGISAFQRGVEGHSTVDHGVVGVSVSGAGVFGHSTRDHGVAGVSEERAGVSGTSTSGNGTEGHSTKKTGVFGYSTNGIGVLGTSEIGEAAVKGDHMAGGLAGLFNGDVQVNGHLTASRGVSGPGADVAEQFGVAGDLAPEPGCVVVLAGGDCVSVSDEPYDRRVAGVVSGAGSYAPGFLLDTRDEANRVPLALTGKVWCKVDAGYGSVSVGDLLTTSPTPGHAMRATDPARAFGAVIGKALGSLSFGRALVPVLIALH